MGILMRRSLQNDDGTNMNGVSIRKELDQASHLKKYGGPLMTNFFGYCLAATAQWLVDPIETENNITKTTFDTKTMNLQMEYENSHTPFADYLAERFPEFENPIRKETLELTPENLYKDIICYNDTKLLTKGRIIIGILDDSSLGHALGVIINGEYYYFLDVNQGICSFAGKDPFWYFIYPYLTNKGGLLDQGYKNFYVTLYSPET